MHSSSKLGKIASNCGKPEPSKTLGRSESRDSTPPSVKDSLPPSSSTAKNVAGGYNNYHNPPEQRRQNHKPVTKPLTVSFHEEKSCGTVSDPFIYEPSFREAHSSPIRSHLLETPLEEDPNTNKSPPSTQSANRSPSKRPGMTRRMISRSKTEPSFPDLCESSVVHRRLGATASLPSISINHPTSPSVEGLDGIDTTNISAKSSLAHGANRKVPAHNRTYASTRSYLAPITVLPAEADSNTQSHSVSYRDLGDGSTHESYIDLTVRWGLDMEVSTLTQITHLLMLTL
jgi:hypothetical protein